MNVSLVNFNGENIFIKLKRNREKEAKAEQTLFTNKSSFKCFIKIAKNKAQRGLYEHKNV
jgi:hypothetical protein